MATQNITVGAGTVAVAIPAGLYATSAANALGHAETREYDPRFGAVLKVTGPNSLATAWQLDDFGRKTRELRADGTKTVSAYCVLASSGLATSANSDTANGDPMTCPTPAAGEAPADAVSFVHSEPRDASSTAGVKMGPYVRIYSDRLGREIRSVTQSYDGANQPTAQKAAAIARDSVYNAWGALIIQTQPYYLASGSSTTTGANDQGLSLTEYDALGRVKTVYVADPAGSQSGITFGAYGTRPAARQSVTYSGLTVTTTNDKGQSRTEEKNAAGQTIRVTDASGAQIAYQHDAFGNLIATRDALQNLVTLVYDTRGRKVSMTDPDSGLWTYDYDALGQLVRQQNPTQRAAATYTTMVYDKLGRMTQRAEPEFTSTWSYDQYADASACTKGIGKLCEASTTNGVTRKHVYDSYGRPLNTRVSIASGPSFASAVAYSATTGRVASQTYPTGLKVNYNYTTGAAKGYLQTLSLASAVTLNPLPATVGGTPGSSTTLTSGTVLWQAQILNAWGQAEQQLYAGNVTGKSSYQAATGRLSDRTAGIGAATGVLSQHYAWDSLANLTGRSDDNGDGTTGAVSETFAYGDTLNRLTQYSVAAASIPNLSRTVTLHYNALGMLLYKSDVGNYSYPTQGSSSVRPHALQSVTGAATTAYTYDANGNLITASAGSYRNIAYTSFNLPDSGVGISGPAGTPKHAWVYDENHARIKEVRTIVGGAQAGTRTTWALHPDNQGGLSFESEVNAPTSPSAANPAVTSNRHYLSAGGQAIGVLVTTGALPTLTPTQTAPPAWQTSTPAVKLEVWHKDHLGSIAATTDHTGALTARYAYDPFGKRRLTNGNYDAMGTLVVDWSPAVNAGTDRGYTGHEQLDDVGLTHMNGRVFDPTLGVFLQADPVMQDPLNLQNYNRYGYCFNNPLSCTDPSGFSFWTKYRRAIIGIAVAIIAPELVGMLLMEAGGAAFVTCSFGVLDGAVTGLSALGNFTSAAVSGFASGAVASGSFEGGLQGAFTAGMFYGAGDLIGGTGAFAGSAPVTDKFAQAAVHGVVGCVTSEVGGGKCGAGAMSAAFSKFATVNGFVGEGAVAGTITSAVVGGTASALGGGTFANGATTAAFGYLFNCLAHSSGPCGKDDWGKIREAYAGCDTDRACMTRVHAAAIEADMPVPRVIMSTATYDFVDLTSKPALLVNPTGWLIDGWKGFGEAMYAFSNSEFVQGGIKLGSQGYGAALTFITKPAGELFSGRFGAVGGLLVEKAFEGINSRPPAKKD